MTTHSTILAWESHRQKSLVGYSVLGAKKSWIWLKWCCIHKSRLSAQCYSGNHAFWLFYTTSIWYGEGNGTPLQYSCPENPMDGGAWWAAVHEVTKSWTRLSDFTFTFHFHALEKEMATHSSVLAWRIPGMREPGGLPSLGSHRVGHHWSDLAAAAADSLWLISWKIFSFWLSMPLLYYLSAQPSWISQKFNLSTSVNSEFKVEWLLPTILLKCLLLPFSLTTWLINSVDIHQSYFFHHIWVWGHFLLL